MERLLHTPEGVRDIYNNECAQKLVLQDRIHSVFKRYGYQDIEPPTFEFFDVFSREVGTIPSKDLYKFFDREGNTLVLRPDFTPSIARAAATYFKDNKEDLRLCYQGSTFINSSSYQGRFKEAAEMGAEFLGDASHYTDAEVLAMVIDALESVGLSNFQLCVGQVDFFKYLLDEAGMDEETEEHIRSLISNKNFFGVEELIEQQNLSKELGNAFLQLPQLFGSVEVLEEAKKLTSNSKALEAIKRLEDIYYVMKIYGYEKYISFDLAILSKYKYYTGIVFQAYTYGTGEPIVKGGRYNNLLSFFGKPSPAIGFSVSVGQLMNALSRQNIRMDIPEQPTILTFNDENCEEVLERAKEMRKHGKCIALRRER